MYKSLDNTQFGTWHKAFVMALTKPFWNGSSTFGSVAEFLDRNYWRLTITERRPGDRILGPWTTEGSGP